MPWFGHGRGEDVEGSSLSRRAALSAVAGGAAALGGAKAVDNVLVGYGVLTGTNLVDQDLAALLLDLGALARGDVAFEFHRTDGFFDRVRGAEARPAAVGALRRWPAADPDVVGAFAGADPADPAALVDGLVGGFREHTFYDLPRYLAGSVQDNVIFGAADLRAPFREPVGFPAIVDGPETGLFCWEFTNLSLEALHAVPAGEQAVPVVGASVVDDRHKHVYTGLLSLIREEGALHAPMTFVDYTHTTLYDDLGLCGIVGEGLEAYNRRHRATEINWTPYA